MWRRWETWELPKTVEINGTIYQINTDFRQILKIIKILNADDLLEVEKAQLVYMKFFKNPEKVKDFDKDDVPEIVQYFMNGNKENEKTKKPILYDWEQDFNLIIAPVNRVAGEELLLKKYVHWWTFLRYFMEIGECTFSTYVSIREKKAIGKPRLDKWEEKIWRENKDIQLKKKHDMETTQLMNRILGK